MRKDSNTWRRGSRSGSTPSSALSPAKSKLFSEQTSEREALEEISRSSSIGSGTADNRLWKPSSRQLRGPRNPSACRIRSEERRVGKSVDVGGRRGITKKKRTSDASVTARRSCRSYDRGLCQCAFDHARRTG